MELRAPIPGSVRSDIADVGVCQRGKMATLSNKVCFTFRLIYHKRNEDAEMDTRKHKQRSHQKCYSRGKGTHKANKHFRHEETTVMVRSVMCSGEIPPQRKTG